MERFVIALTRTCGSGINEALFANADELTRNSLLYRVSKKMYHGELIPPESNNFTSDQNLFNYQAKVLKELADRESYICVGRACDYILKDHPNVLKVFVYAPTDVCIENEMKQQGIERKAAEKYVNSNNKFRREYYKYHTGRIWEDPYNYDLCLNTGDLTHEQAVAVIKAYVKAKFGVE